MHKKLVEQERLKLDHRLQLRWSYLEASMAEEMAAARGFTVSQLLRDILRDEYARFKSGKRR